MSGRALTGGRVERGRPDGMMKIVEEVVRHGLRGGLFSKYENFV
jgi:hypothetical protein